MDDRSKPPEISVVIPAFNEQNRIHETIRRVEAFLCLKQCDWEIIVSNDGSTDRTAGIVEALVKARADEKLRLLTALKNSGKGMAVRRGVLAARGDYVLVTDVDLSAPIKEMDKLIKVLKEGYDIATGCRALREEGCDVQQSFKRWLGGRIFNFFVGAVLMKGFLDTQCGFKCFTRETAQALFSAQKLDGFAFDVEVLYLAKQKGYRIKEVPVMWKEGGESKVRFFRDSFRMLKDLLYLRRYYSTRLSSRKFL